MASRYRALVALLLAAYGCGRSPSSAEPAASATAPVASTLAPATSGVASARPEPAARQLPLQAELHLPALPAGQAAPLLVMLHGLGSSAEQIEASSDWLSFAEQRGIAWLAPNGPLDRHGRRFWDAGPSCCNFDHLDVDHVSALADLIERARSHAGVDRERVFVGGHSNGAFMAHRLACERPDLVRGIVGIAGSAPLDRAACRTPSTLRVLQIQGDADPIVTFAGGHLFRDPSLPRHLSAEKTARDWAQALGCHEPARTLAPRDLELGLPGAETGVQSYGDCRSGKVELWTVHGGSHYIGFRAPAPAAVWSFLSD
jgi:polyhydroxybutyrate depolymerase